MTESINPGYSFESGGFDKKDSGKGNAKKNSAPSFRPSFGESKPAPQFMEVGNTPFSVFSGKDLGGEAVKSAGLFEKDKPEMPKPEAEFREPEARKSEIPISERPAVESPAQEPVKRVAAESEQPKPRENLELQSESSEQLAELAAREARAQLHAQELAQETEESERENDKTKKDKAKDKTTPATQPDVKAEAQAPEPETPRAETLEEMLAREMPAEFVKSTSNETLTNEATPELPPLAETPAEMPAAEQIDATHESPEPRPSQPSELPNFESFVQQQPELGDLAKPLTDESLAAAAEPSAAAEHASDDDIFRKIAQNETGEDPGRATLHDVEPGGPPVSTGGGANRPPNIPPTARGGPGGYGGGPNPNNNPNAFNSNNLNNGPNILNPNAHVNPNMMPGILNPGTAAALAALGARERFHHWDWEHRLAEVGLLGGELLLATGLVGEHLWNNRKRRQMRRDYNKKFKQQNKALKETNQQLEQEHLRHQQTRRQLETVSAAQATTNEELRRTAEHKLPVAEAAAGAGLISAAAASELTARTERTKAGAPALPSANEKINDRELEHRLRNSRELGRAIERNPELRDSLSAAAIATAEKTGVQPHQLRELVGASTYADMLRRERNYEYLQTEPTEDAGQARRAGGGADAHGMSNSLMSQQQSAVPISAQPDTQLSVPTGAGRPAHRSIVKPAVAATILFALGVVLIAIFAA